MEVADENVKDDNHDAWSSCKMSTSGSDGEVGDNPVANQPDQSDPSARNDKEMLCNGSRSDQLTEPQPWVPTMSLLDLAHRLKQAEMRVLGLMQKNNAQLDEPCSEDDSMESFSADKRFLSSDENSKLGRFDTPKSTENSMSSAQRGNVLSSFLGIKTETLSDSNMDESAFDQSKATEFSSPFENSNFDAYKRHQCAWCNYKTDSKSHLLRHQKTVHQFVLPNDSSDAATAALMKSLDSSAEMEVGKTRSMRRHRCELCSYQTDSKSHLRRHQGSVHSTKKPYRCHLCKMEFSRSEKAKEHFMNLHSDVPYDSRKMRKFLPMTKEPNKAAVDTFTKIKLLYKDLDGSPEKSATNGTNASKKEKKDVGNDADDDDDDLSMSELQEKSKTFSSRGDGSKPYMCLKCDYASRDIWHLKRHISDVHLMRKDFKCKICTYATNRQHRFICHMRTHGEIFCFYCDYSNIKLDVFKQHLQLCSALHKMSTEVQCRLCELDCKDHESLKEHMSTVHGAILYSCSECSYYTEIFEDFESHSQIHREEERTCKLCNVVFETKQDLNAHCNAVHIRMGEGRLLTCVICQHQESDRTAMYEHVHQHTPQMFFCSVNDCNFKSTTSKSLVLHSKYYHNKNQADMVNVKEPQPGPSSTLRLRETSVLKSAALGTYSCPICTERPPFRYRKSFEKHMTQHAVESESCPLCQDTFFLHKELQEHAFSIHGVKVV